MGRYPVPPLASDTQHVGKPIVCWVTGIRAMATVSDYQSLDFTSVDQLNFNVDMSNDYAVWLWCNKVSFSINPFAKLDRDHVLLHSLV